MMDDARLREIETRVDVLLHIQATPDEGPHRPVNRSIRIASAEDAIRRHGVEDIPDLLAALSEEKAHRLALEARLAALEGAARESLDALFAEIAGWTMATFPSQTPTSATKHAEKEIAELLVDPANGEEQADVVMLMIAAAASAGNDLKAELRRKLAINRTRTWGAPDADGVVEHERAPSDAPAPAPQEVTND